MGSALLVLALSFGITGKVPDTTRDLVAQAADLAGSDACGGEVLRRFGVDRSGPTHLIFRGTIKTSSCPRQTVLATTTRGGAMVNLCTPQFNLAALQDPQTALVVLVHEILHTQGLGEAPVHPGMPTSQEISRAVEDACGLSSGKFGGR